MAIYRLEARIIGREKRGRSVVAASAYRSGKKLLDELRGQVADYLRRSKGVVQTVILSPAGAPEWACEAGKLWNNVERGEKRADAQLAREFILAMPKELDAKQQWEAAVEWAQKELVNKGMVAELSLHHPRNGRNPHVHILCTMRRFDGDEFSSKKERGWNDKKVLMDWRKSWEVAANAALEKAGSDARVDSRSLKDQGIDRIPEPKIGVAATAMRKRGLETFRHQLVSYVRSLNFVKPWLRQIQKNGEVYQQGLGKTWWERSLLSVSEKRDVVRQTVADVWQSIKTMRISRQPDIPPPGRDRDREPDI